MALFFFGFIHLRGLFHAPMVLFQCPFETLETRALAHETLKQATLSLLFERFNGL